MTSDLTEYIIKIVTTAVTENLLAQRESQKQINNQTQVLFKNVSQKLAQLFNYHTSLLTQMYEFEQKKQQQEQILEIIELCTDIANDQKYVSFDQVEKWCESMSHHMHSIDNHMILNIMRSLLMTQYQHALFKKIYEQYLNIDEHKIWEQTDEQLINHKSGESQ